MSCYLNNNPHEPLNIHDLSRFRVYLKFLNFYWFYFIYITRYKFATFYLFYLVLWCHYARARISQESCMQDSSKTRANSNSFLAMQDKNKSLSGRTRLLLLRNTWHWIKWKGKLNRLVSVSSMVSKVAVHFISVAINVLSWRHDYENDLIKRNKKTEIPPSMTMYTVCVWVAISMVKLFLPK